MSHSKSLQNIEHSLALSLVLTAPTQADNSQFTTDSLKTSTTNSSASQKSAAKTAPPTQETPQFSMPSTVAPNAETQKFAPQAKSIDNESTWRPPTESSASVPNASLETQMLTKHKREFWEARIAELNARYQELRRNAVEDGIDLSPQTPWTDNANFVVNPKPPYAPQAYAPQEANYVDSAPAESSNLEKMQAIINSMTPEERDVCTTVHRLSMGLMQSSVMPPSQPPPQPPPPQEPNRYSYPYEYGRSPNYGYGANPPAHPPHPQGYSPQGYNYPYGYGNYRAPNWQGGGW